MMAMRVHNASHSSILKWEIESIREVYRWLFFAHFGRSSQWSSSLTTIQTGLIMKRMKVVHLAQPPRQNNSNNLICSQIVEQTDTLARPHTDLSVLRLHAHWPSEAFYTQTWQKLSENLKFECVLPVWGEYYGSPLIDDTEDTVPEKTPGFGVHTCGGFILQTHKNYSSQPLNTNTRGTGSIL